MSSRTIYKLAMFSNEFDQWVFINKSFIIENTDLLSGLFLSDIWFSHKIDENCDDYHFMILEIDNPSDLENALELINKNHKNKYNGVRASILDKPTDYHSNFSRYFHITRKIIKNAKKQIDLENKDTQVIKLYDDNCLFKIELMKFEEMFLLSLPKFNLF
jgi:hypothetical protein